MPPPLTAPSRYRRSLQTEHLDSQVFQIERTAAISDTAPGGCLHLSHGLDYLLECECFQMDSEDDLSVYLRRFRILHCPKVIPSPALNRQKTALSCEGAVIVSKKMG